MKNFLTALCATGVALLAPASLAALPHTEDFEKQAEGSLNINAGGEGKYWDSPEATKGSATQSGSMGDLAIVTAYKDNFPRPENGGGKRYLAVDTGEPLQRYVQAGGEPLEVDTGLYFEGDVLFTPYDSDTEVEANENDKLLIYLQTMEPEIGDDGSIAAPGATNFIVKAGYYNAYNDAVATNYVCGLPKNFLMGAWHRLVVKTSLLDGKYTMFKIEVDGEPLTANVQKGDAGSVVEKSGAHVFPSIMTTGNNKARMVSAGFKGQGSIDNITWTNVDSEPVVVKYVFKWNPDEGSPVVKVNGVVMTVENGKEFRVTETDRLEYAFEAVAEKAAAEPEVKVADGATTIPFKVRTAEAKLAIDGVEYYVGDFAAAVAKLSEGLNMDEDAPTTNITAVVTLLADGSATEASRECGVCLAPTNTILDLNGYSLTITGAGLFGNGALQIKNSGANAATLTADKIYAPDLTILDGKFKFSTEPFATDAEDQEEKAKVPDGKKLEKVNGSWELVDADGNADEAGGPGGTDTADKNNAPAKGDATNVMGVSGADGGAGRVMANGVDITGAFKAGSTTDLNPDGSVTVNDEEIKVKPEIVEATVANGVATVKVKAIPGLTYMLKAATDLAKVRTQEATKAARKTADGSGTVELKDESASASAKFYVIEVTR